MNNNINYDPFTGKPVFYNQNSASKYNKNENNKFSNSGNKKRIFVLLVILLILGAVSLGTYKFFFKDKGQSSETISEEEVTVFFLQNADKKKALFNKDGKQLTDFIYTGDTIFSNGLAIVQTDDGKGIINTDGELVVPIGKYKYIYGNGFLYSVMEGNESYFIDSTGKKVLDGVSDGRFIGDRFVLINNYEKQKYILLNAYGKEILSFDDVDNGDTPSTDSEYNYATIFYNNKSWLLDDNTGKVLTSFESTKRFCVNSVSFDKNSIILSSCSFIFETEEKTDYKILKNGKLFDDANGCNSIYLNHDNLVCKKSEGTYALDSNLNATLNITYAAYRNINDGYVIENKDNNPSVSFYQNNQVIKSIPCKSLIKKSYNLTDIYLLNNASGDSCEKYETAYEYYNSQGEKIIDKSFKSASDFGNDDRAIVSDDFKSYYLIDKDGTQKGKNYDKINARGDFYEIYQNKRYGVMDKDGEEIIPPTYVYIKFDSHNGDYYAFLNDTDKKYTIYNLSQNKELFKSSNYPTFSANYMTVYENGSLKHYTYDGVMFYEK